jgi:DNA polymerase III psi subunit
MAMPVTDPLSRQRLAAMGIDVWVQRQPMVATQSRPAATAEAAVEHSLRIRMASGSGDWLLVQREPWSGRHEQLLADITAVIGADRCRFGQWAISDSAGVPVAELESRGIVHVLAFGEPPRAVDSSQVCLVPPLVDIAAGAAARRHLWQALAPRLGR